MVAVVLVESVEEGAVVLGDGEQHAVADALGHHRASVLFHDGATIAARLGMTALPRRVLAREHGIRHGRRLRGVPDVADAPRSRAARPARAARVTGRSCARPAVARDATTARAAVATGNAARARCSRAGHAAACRRSCHVAGASARATGRGAARSTACSEAGCPRGRALSTSAGAPRAGRPAFATCRVRGLLRGAAPDESAKSKGL